MLRMRGRGLGRPNIRDTKIVLSESGSSHSAPFGQTTLTAAQTANVTGEPNALISPSIVASHAWIVASLNAGVLTVQTDPDGQNPGVYNGTIAVKAANADQAIYTVSMQVDTPPPVPILNATSLTPFATVESQGNPAAQHITISNVGTGTLAGVAAIELVAESWLSLTLTGAGNDWDVQVDIDNSALLNANTPYTGTIRISADSPALNTPIDIPVRVDVAPPPPPPGTLYPAWPNNLPAGMGQDRATNKPTGSPLTWRYSDNLVTSWLDIDGSLGSNDVSNMAVLQGQLNTDAGGTPVRRGYEFGSTRNFRGELIIPHNAAAGTTGFRPLGYSYNKDLKTPPSSSRVAPTFIASVGNTTAGVHTSTSGAVDQNHGRVVFLGLKFTVSTTLGQTFTNNFNAAIIDFGSPYADQSTASRRPNGFLLHDCHVTGYATGWVRRGIGLHGENCEIRACLIDHIHSNPRPPSNKDAQCIGGWNGTAKVEIRYTIAHGGDENIAWGGGGPLSADQAARDIWVDHCDLGKNAAYLASWGAKNAYEPKAGENQLITFCRAWGMVSANDNQGYAFTIKTGVYSSFATEFSSHVTIHGCWVQEYPAMLALVGHEGVANGAVTHHVSMTDCFGWNLCQGTWSQANRKLLFANNDGNSPLSGIFISHNTIACASPIAGSATAFGAPGSCPGIQIHDNIFPFFEYGFFASVGSGTAMLNDIAPGPTWAAARNTFCPKATMPSGYPSAAPNDGWTAVSSFAALGMVDQASGNLRLNSSSPYYKGNALASPDGWNRGVTDPAMVYAELAETPLYTG